MMQTQMDSLNKYQMENKDLKKTVADLSKGIFIV